MIDSEIELPDIVGRLNMLRDDAGVARVEDEEEDVKRGVGRAFVVIA